MQSCSKAKGGRAIGVFARLSDAGPRPPFTHVGASCAILARELGAHTESAAPSSQDRVKMV